MVAQPKATEHTDAVLHALADPQRRRILQLVRDGELAAGEIAQHFDVTQQGVSHHLRVLQRAGLLTERREATRRLYALDVESLAPVRAMLNDLWPAALQRLKAVVEANHPPTEAAPTKSARTAAPKNAPKKKGGKR